jgi:N,N'-diacetyllegionaminate synthase
VDRVVNTLRAGHFEIGGGRCFVIAEAGVNHNADPDMAHRLVDAAADAGAEAVKFQTFDPARLASAVAVKADYQRRSSPGASQREMLEALVLPRALHPELQTHAAERGLCFLSTPFDEESANFLASLGVPALKVASGEVTNHAFLAHVARLGLPVLLSTGMSTLGEVEAAVAVLEDAGAAGRLAMLHCVSSYPAPAAESNLRAMDTLRHRFRVPVGWSDHTEGIAVALAAVARGADILEKHFTLDRRLPGPDHAASLEPDELATLVAGVRQVRSSLGDGVKRPVSSEEGTTAVARRSLHARHELSAGTTLAAADLVALRPGTGIPPSRLSELVGRRLARSVAAGAQLSDADVE